MPASELQLRRCFRRLGRVLGLSPRTIHRRVIEASRRRRTPTSRSRPTSRAPPSTTSSSARTSSPASTSRSCSCAPIRTRSSPPSCSGRCARSPARAEEEEVPRRRRRHAHRQGRHRGDLRPLPARPGRLHARRHQRARQPRRPPRGHAPRAQQGHLRLTLDLDLQRAANNAMKRAIGAANANGNPSKAGAYVAMDPTNGEVLALGSYPSFDANVFAKPLSQETFDTLNSEENGAPLFNRAIAAAYPTGSTFKPITAMAALEEGIITPTQTIFDDGEFKLGPQVLPQRPQRPLRLARDAARAAGLLRRLLLHARRARELARRRSSRGGREARPRAPDRDRHPGRVRRPRARPALARRGLRQVPQLRQAREGAGPDAGGAAEAAAASSGRGPRATTSTSPSARATSRRRRCRWRRPTRRSPTAAGSCGRTSR